MLDLVAASLAKHGSSVVRQAPDAGAQEKARKELAQAYDRLHSTVPFIILLLTLLLSIVAALLLQYTVYFVVGNLAAIEDVHDASTAELELDELLADEDDDAEELTSQEGLSGARASISEDSLKDWEDASTPAQTSKRTEEGRSSRPQIAPVTRNIRTAIAHLGSVGGFRCLFHGFRFYLLVLVFYLLFSLSFRFALPVPFLDGLLGSLVGTLVSIPVHCAWTHATIRAPRPNQVRRSEPGLVNRHVLGVMATHTFLPSRFGVPVRHWLTGVWSKHLFLPSLRLALANAVISEGTLAITMALAKTVEAGANGSASPLTACLVFAIPALYAVLTGLVLGLPAGIALVRIEASILPDSDRALVPFDRSFDGRAACWQSTDLSWWRYISLNLGPLGAFKTFDREAYFRVLWVYIKIIPFLLLLFLTCMVVLALELWVIVGSQFVPIMLAWVPGAHGN